MEIVALLVILVLQGLVVGAFARLALPGPDPLTIPQTIALGLAGSLLSLVAYAVSGGRVGASFLVALVGSVLILYFVRRRRGGGLASPGEPRG